jgi:hypothetical protein
MTIYLLPRGVSSKSYFLHIAVIRDHAHSSQYFDRTGDPRPRPRHSLNQYT